MQVDADDELIAAVKARCEQRNRIAKSISLIPPSSSSATKLPLDICF